MKTIIHTWVLKPKNGRDPIGLGDMLRGAVWLHYVCNKLGYRFMIDISQHPISSYINGYSNDLSNI
jgi:hypothetical protein